VSRSVVFAVGAVAALALPASAKPKFTFLGLGVGSPAPTEAVCESLPDGEASCQLPKLIHPPLTLVSISLLDGGMYSAGASFRTADFDAVVSMMRQSYGKPAKVLRRGTSKDQLQTVIWTFAEGTLSIEQAGDDPNFGWLYFENSSATVELSRRRIAPH